MRKIVIAVLLASGFQLSAEIPTVRLTLARVVSTPTPSTPTVQTPTIVVPAIATPTRSIRLPLIWSKSREIMGPGWNEKYPYLGTALGREWADLQRDFNAAPLPLPTELETRILQYHLKLKTRL
ncbi:MAG: hypothetical protein D4R65_01435 [Verrucomicrobiaceae bacterium]|nr:MAG: hypothetical protein D4R65_01435 [Verrucomicrobiaceae bacterium]